jgi:outer membrane lipoprotein-sorting protein
MRKVLHLAAAAAVALFYVTPLAAQTVDELIAKNLQARGGEAKLRATTTMRLTGKVTVQGMELPMTVSAKRPNMMRQEMQIQDKRVVTAFDGDKAWMINPMMGADAPQEVQGAQADMTREQSDFDGPLMDYKSKGTTVELVKGDGPDGTEKLADGTKVYKLKITRKGGRIQYIYLDSASGIEVKTTNQIEQGGQTYNIETELADYRPEGGLMVPHSVRNVMNGQPLMQMTVDKVEFNVPIEDSFFKMPAAKP